MSLKLHYHPLASFCHKPLSVLYENGTPFEPVFIDLSDEESSARFRALWPMAKMPVLQDTARGRVVPESTIVVEYLDRFYPGPVRLVPEEPDLAWQTRLWDRFYDCYVQEPMQKIVLDRLRPEGNRDQHGVEQAKKQVRSAYDMLEGEMRSKTWAMGEIFTMADCAAAPALFYANAVVPFGEQHGNAAAYLDRLMARPSFARVLEEAEPYFKNFPLDRKPQISRPRATIGS